MGGRRIRERSERIDVSPFPHDHVIIIIAVDIIVTFLFIIVHETMKLRNRLRACSLSVVGRTYPYYKPVVGIAKKN